MNKSNSWQTLKDTFKDTKPVPQKVSPFNRTSLKRKGKIRPLSLSPATKYIDLTKSDDSKENSIAKSASKKRPATTVRNVTQALNQDSDVDDDDGVIYHDPDYDDIPLPSSNPKLARNIQLPFTTTRENILESTLRPPNKSNNNTGKQAAWSNLQATFAYRSLSKEMEQLENSIIDSDDDEIQATGCSAKSITKRKRYTPRAKRRRSDPVIEFSESPILTQGDTDIFIDTQSSGRTIVAASPQQAAVSSAPLQQSPKRKRIKKGGLVESLQDAINRAKSNLSFWLNERQSDLIKSGEIVCISKIEEQYGRILIHCQFSDNEIRIICLNSNHRILQQLTIGKSIEVEFDPDGYTLDSIENCKIYPNVYKIRLR